MALRVGTRRSRLALAQSREVAARLAAVGIETELVPMVTAGDRGVPLAASRAGLKGLFVAEIVRALQEGRVDLAVHSAKDLPARDPAGVVVAAVPERASPFDVLVTRDGHLPDGGRVGTSSLRRRAQLLRWRPDLEVRPLRGNVDTRLARLEAGEVDGVVLAAAGLRRLGVQPPHATHLLPDVMVPAPGQGALAVQARAGDRRVLEALAALEHPDSRLAFEAERALVARLGGGCALPLGAYAVAGEGRVLLTAVVASPDGKRLVRVEAQASTAEAAAEAAERELRAGGARAILAEVLG